MTHSLHRRGTEENLSNDYIVFAIAAQGINADGASAKFARFAEVVEKYEPVSFGDMKTGNVFSVGMEEIKKNFKDNSIVHAVFTDPDVVAEVLKELKEIDLGLSIVVSGLLEPVDRCCRQAGTPRHTVEHSLGIWGRTETLPGEKVLEVSTMCGHGMVAFGLVEEMVDRIKAGTTTPKEAALELARQCHCGIFNPVRAEKLLASMGK